MKKYFKYYAIIWAVSLVLFNVVTFATAASMGFDMILTSYWVGYLFITVVFIGNLICNIIFFKEENKDKVFLNMPVYTLAYSALILSLVVGIITMMLPMMPVWLGIIIDVIILCFYVVSITQATAAAQAVTDLGYKVKAQTLFIKSLTVDAQGLVSNAKTDKTKELADNAYEAIRFSDPMSNTALDGIEKSIAQKFNEFKNAVNKSDDALACAKCDELLALVEDRNSKCKLLK